MTNYIDLVDLGVENTTTNIQRVLREFPFFMQESDLHQYMAVMASQEIGSRLRDALDAVYRNSMPSTVEEMGIPYWQILLDYPSLHGDTLEVARARILSKTVRFERRVTDIANIVRLYLQGNRTYTSASVNQSNLIPVNSIEGFEGGQLIFIGPSRAIITEVDAAASILRLDRDISAHVFELVSDSPVIITQLFPPLELYDSVNTNYDSTNRYDSDNTGAYFFFIYIEKSRILSLERIIETVTDARPAHLNFMILSYPPLLYSDNNYTYNGVFTDPADYNNVGSYVSSGLTYGGVSDLGSYDSSTQSYDDPERRYDNPNAPGILYNGSEILFGGY